MPHHHGKHHTHRHGGPRLRKHGSPDAAHAPEDHIHDHVPGTNSILENSIPETCPTCSVDVGEVQIVGEKNINHLAIDTEAGELVIIEPRFALPEEGKNAASVVTATILNIIAGTRTIAEFTVASLPAVVSNSDIGIITIPANLHTPLVVTHFTIPPPTSSSTSSTARSTSNPTATITSSTSSSSSSSSNSHTSSSQSSTSSHSTVPITVSTPSSSSLSTSTPSATTTAATSSASSGSSSNTPKIVGGVVGGVGGFLLLLLLAFLFFRWRRHQREANVAGNTGEATRGLGPSQGPSQGPEAPSAEVSQQSSTVPLETAAGASTAATIFPWWRASTQTVGTEDSTPSERGFQKISGRKIPSVLRTGGDGYGDVEGDSSSPPQAAAAAAAGGAVGHGSTAPSSSPRSVPRSRGPSPAFHPSPSNERLGESAAILRPGPGTPVARNVQSASSSPTAGRRSAEPIHEVLLPPRPDALGRSLSSYDGSRGSRFTESIE